MNGHRIVDEATQERERVRQVSGHVVRTRVDNGAQAEHARVSLDQVGGVDLNHARFFVLRARFGFGQRFQMILIQQKTKLNLQKHKK